MEEWKDIAGYEGLYQVSSLGRIKSLNYNKTGKERILKARDKGGYLQVTLCKDGKYKNCTIHRLVAKAFIPNPYNLPEVNHIDENKGNNCVDNLEWCTRKYNNNYGTRTKKTSKPVIAINKVSGLILEFPSIMEAERTTGIDNSHIVACCKGKGRYKSAGGYIWQYL